MAIASTTAAAAFAAAHSSVEHDSSSSSADDGNGSGGKDCSPHASWAAAWSSASVASAIADALGCERVTLLLHTDAHGTVAAALSEAVQTTAQGGTVAPTATFVAHRGSKMLHARCGSGNDSSGGCSGSDSSGSSGSCTASIDVGATLLKGGAVLLSGQGCAEAARQCVDAGLLSTDGGGGGGGDNVRWGIVHEKAMCLFSIRLNVSHVCWR